MKKIYTKFTPALILMILSHALAAQSIFVEHTNTVPDSPRKVQPDFDKQNYTQITDENGLKIYMENQPVTAVNHSTAEEGVNDNVYLHINLAFDLNTYFPFIAKVYNESGYENTSYFIGENPITFEVPQGNYDVFFLFYNMNSQQSLIVIKEQQEINEETTLTFNPEEAGNYISINTYDENGEALNPGVYNPQTELNSGMVFNRIIHFQPSDLRVMDEAYIWEFPFENDPVWNFYINDVSDRYSVSQFFIGYGNEDNINYFNKMPSLTGIAEPAEIQNDPEEYIWHVEKLQPTLLNEGENKFPGFFTWVIFNDFTTNGWTIYNSDITVSPEEAFKGYLYNPVEEGAANLLVYPMLGDHLVVDQEWGDEYPYFIKGNPVYTDDGEIKYGSGNTSNYSFVNEGLKELPFHQQFTFTGNNNPDIVEGNNTPIAITLPYLIPDEMNYFDIDYKGIYGEVRESDYFNTQAEVRQNGTVIFTGNLTDSFIPLNGEIELTLTNSNVQVEDMTGTNTTKIFYNASQTDIPPALQALQFRNDSGKVGNVLESVNNSEVRLAAADHEYHPDTTLFSYIEGNTVEFYYSLHAQENWTELELNNDPDYFQSPGLGDYYQASLQNILVPADNSWFDVKIICTDSAGNKQEQIISPAFKIEQATMGIKEIDKSVMTVYPNPFTTELNVQLPENFRGNYVFKVSDLSGKTIYSKTQSEKSFTWNGSSLPIGIYTLQIESNGKIIAQKVIKK